MSGGPEKGLARVADARGSDLRWIHFALWSVSDLLLHRLNRHGLSSWPDGVLMRRVLARCPARRAPCSTRPPKTVPQAHHVLPQRVRLRPSQGARSVLGLSAATPNLMAAPRLVRIGILTYSGLVRVETDFGCLQPCTASIVVRASGVGWTQRFLEPESRLLFSMCMHSSASTLGKCPVVLLHGTPGPSAGFTGEGYSGIVTRPPCRIVVTSDGSSPCSEIVIDLAKHIDQAIRELIVFGASVPCPVRRVNSWDFEVMMPRESIRVLVVVGDRNSPALSEHSALAELCDSWTQSTNSYIVPVAEEDTDFHKWLPPFISKLNATFWSGDDFYKAVNDILYVAGLDPSRRVFISYRRKECSVLSEQLFEALSKERCDVFLDRYCVPPARDFQEKLTEDLADKSLVLVLESPTIMQSEWVQYEVNFAKMNKIGILAIQPPQLTFNSQVGSIGDDSRIKLNDRQFVNSRLTDQGLHMVIRQILTDMRIAYYRRLFDLNEGLIFGLRMRGISVEYDPSGIILAQNSSRYGLWTTPFFPTLFDFYNVSTSRTCVQYRCILSPAHAYAGLERRTVTGWLAGLANVSLYRPSQILDLTKKIQGG